MIGKCNETGTDDPFLGNFREETRGEEYVNLAPHGDSLERHSKNESLLNVFQSYYLVSIEVPSRSAKRVAAGPDRMKMETLHCLIYGLAVV